MERFYKAAIVRNAERNALVLEAVARAEARMVFVDELEHGENMTFEIMARGFSVQFARGESTPRRAPRRDPQTPGGSSVGVASTVFNEGVDVPVTAPL